MTYYQICWYFLIYSCIGWCLEVTFHAVSLGLVINRGFLNGPVCPVYGFGMLLLYLAIVLVRNFFEPKIIGDQVGLHPLATLASMFVGLRFAGVFALLAIFNSYFNMITGNFAHCININRAGFLLSDSR